MAFPNGESNYMTVTLVDTAGLPVTGKTHSDITSAQSTRTLRDGSAPVSAVITLNGSAGSDNSFIELGGGDYKYKFPSGLGASGTARLKCLFAGADFWGSDEITFVEPDGSALPVNVEQSDGVAIADELATKADTKFTGFVPA